MLKAIVVCIYIHKHKHVQHHAEGGSSKVMVKITESRLATMAGLTSVPHHTLYGIFAVCSLCRFATYTTFYVPHYVTKGLTHKNKA